MLREGSNRDIFRPQAEAFLPLPLPLPSFQGKAKAAPPLAEPMRQQLHATRAIPGCWATSFAAGPPSRLLRSHETFRALLGSAAIREDGARRVSPSSREKRSGTSHGAMSRKRLITDSFQVVKKKGDRKERKEAQSPPQDLVQAESHLPVQDTAQPDQLEILKQFDLSWQYGPCTGITRMQRWERAKFLGLNPPTTVQDLLLKYNKDPFVIYSLWHEYTL